MASFNCFNTGCMVKSEVKTEVTPVVIEPSTPQQTPRLTSVRLYRPWEDSPSRPCTPPGTPQCTSTPRQSSSTPMSCSPSTHSNSTPMSCSSATLNSSAYSNPKSRCSSPRPSSTHSSASSTHSSASSTHSSASSTHSSASSTHSSASSTHSSASSTHSSASSTHSSASSTHSSNEVTCQHASFLRAVSRLQGRVHPSDTWLATLASCYLSEVFRLETFRSHALVAALPPTPAVHAAVHQHYDSERLALLQQANSSLVGYSCSLQAASSRASSPLQQLTPPTTPTSSHLDRSYSSGSGASSPDSTPSPRLQHSRLTIDGTPSSSRVSTSSNSSSNRRLLGAGAVRVLEAWYGRHQHYPYADAAQVRHLAAAAGLTLVQVRKWLANRRLRGHNTTGYVGKSLKTRRALSSSSPQ